MVAMVAMTIDKNGAKLVETIAPAIAAKHGVAKALKKRHSLVLNYPRVRGSSDGLARDLRGQALHCERS